MSNSFATSQTVACQAPLSMGFPRQEWVAIPFSRGSSDPRIEPASPALEGRFFIAEPPGKKNISIYVYIFMRIGL